MTKTVTLVALAIAIFVAGYSQTISTQQKKVSVLAEDEIIIKTGNASITMKKDGTIIIKGSNIIVEGTSSVNVKASGNVILKGSKIGQN